MEKQKILWSVISGAVAAFAKQYTIIIICVAAVVIFDFITGLIAAKANGVPISSQVASKGFWKKVALFAALFFGFFLDFFIPYMLRYLNIEMPISALFGMIFGCYIVINESISIAENLYRCNPDILPTWVITLLTGAKEQLDSKDKEENNDTTDK